MASNITIKNQNISYDKSILEKISKKKSILEKENK